MITTRSDTSTRLTDTGSRSTERSSELMPKTHGEVCLVAWTLTYWIKQNAYLNKISEKRPTTFNEIKQAINSILEFASTRALSKNEKLADAYFKIKSKRLKKKSAA